MTYRELIKIIGYTTFHKMAKDWYDEKHIFDHGLDNHIDSYAIWGYKPFYLINEAYNIAYKKDMDIGYTYDWLSEYPTKEEIDWWKNGNV